MDAVRLVWRAAPGWTALNAGLAFFGVTTGTHTAAELRAAGATEIFPDLPAIQRRLAG